MANVKCTVQNNMNKKAMLECGKRIGKSAVQRMAEEIYKESQENCPIDSGRLKASGYIRLTEEGYIVGYDCDYAEYVDRMPQSFFNNTGHGGKAQFFTNAIEHQKGGVINVR